MENPELWSNVGKILLLGCQLVCVGGSAVVGGVVFWTLFMVKNRAAENWEFQINEQRHRR